MLAVEKKDKLSLKEFCIDTLKSRPEVSDHMDKKLFYQKKDYLSGFYVDNYFNGRILNFSNEFDKDRLIINNEIDNFILQNRKNFTDDNSLNNDIVSNEVDKIKKSFRDEAQKKQKEFEDQKESIIYDFNDIKKMVESQRKSIKQLRSKNKSLTEKNKSLTEARNTVVKEMEEAHTLWTNSNPGTKLTRHVQIDVKEARRLKDKLKSDNS